MKKKRNCRAVKILFDLIIMASLKYGYHNNLKN